MSDVEKAFVIGGKIRKAKAILGAQAHQDRDGVARVTLLTLQLFELQPKRYNGYRKAARRSGKGIERI